MAGPVHRLIEQRWAGTFSGRAGPRCGYLGQAVLTSLKGIVMKRTLLLPHEPLTPVVESSPISVDDVGSAPAPSEVAG